MFHEGFAIPMTCHLLLLAVPREVSTLFYTLWNEVVELSTQQDEGFAWLILAERVWRGGISLPGPGIAPAGDYGRLHVQPRRRRRPQVLFHCIRHHQHLRANSRLCQHGYRRRRHQECEWITHKRDIWGYWCIREKFCPLENILVMDSWCMLHIRWIVSVHHFTS